MATRSIPILAIALSLALIVGISSGGTVTLTGTCTGSVLTASSNVVTLNITNSGDDSAIDLRISPLIYGFSATNEGPSSALLPPQGGVSYRFTAANLSTNGSYVEQFFASYDQGQSQFHALFPCLVFVGHSVTGNVSISSVKQQSDGSIVVSVNNTYGAALNATVEGFAPDPIAISPQSQKVSLPPGVSTLSFSRSSTGALSASYVSDFVVSYEMNGTHYSSLFTYVIGSSAPSPNNVLSFVKANLVWLATAAAVVALLALIALSLFAHRRARRQ
jgi:hypothetical protein